MKMSVVFLPVSMTMAMALSSCTVTFVVDPAPVAVWYDGSWSGITSQGLPFTFEVVDNQVTRIDLDYRIRRHDGTSVTSLTFSSDPYCSPCTHNPIPIEDGYFSVHFDLPYGGYCSVAGSFRSEYRVGGELLVSEECCYDDLLISWNAEVY